MVVQGTVLRNGSNVSLTVVLIDARRMRQVGSAEFDDPSGDLARVQHQAVVHLARIMKINAPEATASVESIVPNAYESYLKALGYLQRYDKPGNTDLAISELRSSVSGRLALPWVTRRLVRPTV
jgi:hypothetical protein